MAESSNDNITLSSGAIKNLESQIVSNGSSKTINVDYTFQIEKAYKNNIGLYSCSLLDKDSKYAGFLLQYDKKDGIPGVGDIIHVSKIIIAVLPTRQSHIYCCKNVTLIKRAMSLQVDPNTLLNISKINSLKNYKNSIYKAQRDNSNEEIHSKNDNIGSFDDSGCALISSLTTFTNNPILYLKCKIKNPIKYFVSKISKKNCILQSFIFCDTKGDEIQAISFGKQTENLNKSIEEGGVYIIKKAIIQFADKAYNPTKCDYKLLLNESSQYEKAPDNGKFGGVKYIIIPIKVISEFPIGKLIDIFGFILEDKGYQIYTTKNDKVIRFQKLIIGDNSFYKIELTLWEPLGNDNNKFVIGDLLAAKNCRLREFNGKKFLCTTYSSEIRNSLNIDKDIKLKSFYQSHKSVNEYKDIE